MLRIELRASLDRAVLDKILELIEDTTAIEGHRPVGEHKYSHLAVGATGWVGVLAYDEDRLVGYAHTRWNQPGQRPRMAVEVVVHPDYHGTEVAPRLLDETQRLLGRAGGGLLYLWVHRVQDAATTLAAKLGFDIQRELAFMTRRLTRPPDPVEFPHGVEVRPYRPGTDDAPFLEVNNAAFEGHPENGDWDLDDLAQRRGMDWFDPDGLLMAWQTAPLDGLPAPDGPRLLGFHWTKWHGHDSDEVPAHEPVGEVYVLALHPDAQGLGLGEALLAAGLDHLYERGCRLAVLYVDTASAAAVGLYESAGFTTAYQEVCYQRWVEPVPPGPSGDLLRPA